MILNRFSSLLLILVIYVHYYHSKFVDGDSATETILNDIRNAFQIVTNNTGVLNRIIPKMYDLSKNHASEEFTFKIPDGENGFSMLSIQRSDFMAPIFPNLSTAYMKVMRSRWKDIDEDEINQHNNNKISESLAGHKQPTTDWSILGLEGWTGDISKPIQGGTTAKESDTYPVEDIFKDLSIGDIDTLVADIKTTVYADNNVNTKFNNIGEIDVTHNTYIARVNDPFGVSAKWQLRNASNLDHFKMLSHNFTDERSKRNVIELYSMIKCSTGCDPILYKGYGCYCGFLGDGVPVNGIDRCCKVHDKCYENSNCISYLEYFVPYVWKCYRGKPLCAVDHGEWGGPRSCAARLCYCDLKLSRCLRKFSCPRHRAVCKSSTVRQLQSLILF